MRLEPASHGGSAMTGSMMEQVADHFEPVLLTAPDLQDFRRMPCGFRNSTNTSRLYFPQAPRSSIL